MSTSAQSLQQQYGLTFKSTWLHSQSNDVSALTTAVLNSDLSVCVESSQLQLNNNNAVQRITQPVLLEVLSYCDTHADPVNNASNNTQLKPASISTGKNRMLRLILSDGINTYNAMEVEHINVLNTIKIGNKLLLSNFSVRMNMILLCNCNVKVLGGTTPDTNFKLQQLQTVNNTTVVSVNSVPNNTNTAPINNISNGTHATIQQPINRQTPVRPAPVPYQSVPLTVSLPQRTTVAITPTASNSFVSAAQHKQQIINVQSRTPTIATHNTYQSTPTNVPMYNANIQHNIPTVSSVANNVAPTHTAAVNNTGSTIVDEEMKELDEYPWLNDSENQVSAPNIMNRTTTSPSTRTTPVQPTSSGKKLVDADISTWCSPTKTNINNRQQTNNINTTTRINTTQTTPTSVVQSTPTNTYMTPTTPIQHTPVRSTPVEIIDIDSPRQPKDVTQVKIEQQTRERFQLDISMNDVSTVPYMTVSSAIAMSTQLLKPETVQVLAECTGVEGTFQFQPDYILNCKLGDNSVQDMRVVFAPSFVTQLIGVPAQEFITWPNNQKSQAANKVGIDLQHMRGVFTIQLQRQQNKQYSTLDARHVVLGCEKWSVDAFARAKQANAISID